LPVDQLIGRPTVFFSAGRLTGVFFFGLPILDRIESPTVAIIPRLYSDNGIDSAPAVSIVGPSLSSSLDSTDNVAMDFDLRAAIHAWRVLRCRRSDQPIWRTSTSSTSPSMRLPPTKYRAAVASSLWDAVPPPLVQAAGFQRAFIGM
jgi:hypothetical protein